MGIKTEGGIFIGYSDKYSSNSISAAGETISGITSGYKRYFDDGKLYIRVYDAFKPADIKNGYYLLNEVIVPIYGKSTPVNNQYAGIVATLAVSVGSMTEKNDIKTFTEYASGIYTKDETLNGSGESKDVTINTSAAYIAIRNAIGDKYLPDLAYCISIKSAITTGDGSVDTIRIDDVGREDDEEGYIHNNKYTFSLFFDPILTGSDSDEYTIKIGTGESYLKGATLINNNGKSGFEINISNLVGISKGNSGWSYISDIRDKIDIQKISTVNSKDFILSLKPVVYNMNARDMYIYNNTFDIDAYNNSIFSSKRRIAGLLAQDVLKSVNSIFHERIPGMVNELNNDLYGSRYSISYTDILPYLISLIQEQKIRIKKIKDAINKNRNSGDHK